MRRLRLVPDDTNIDFFSQMRSGSAVSILGVIVTFLVVPSAALNFGVDFRGGTLILAELPEAQDVGDYPRGAERRSTSATSRSPRRRAAPGGQVMLMRLGTEGRGRHPPIPDRGRAAGPAPLDVAVPGE